MNSKLHPKLLRYVISLFKNKNVNKKGAQLLMISNIWKDVMEQIHILQTCWQKSRGKVLGFCDFYFGIKGEACRKKE